MNECECASRVLGFMFSFISFYETLNPKPWASCFLPLHHLVWAVFFNKISGIRLYPELPSSHKGKNWCRASWHYKWAPNLVGSELSFVNLVGSQKFQGTRCNM
jgi:hypothetical protein